MDLKKSGVSVLMKSNRLNSSENLKGFNSNNKNFKSYNSNNRNELDKKKVCIFCNSGEHVNVNDRNDLWL